MDTLNRVAEKLSDRRWFLILLLLIYVPVIFYGLSSRNSDDSDEYIYFNMAKAVVDGKLPYRDFFCAHMPLIVYPIALVYSILGVSIWVGKLLALMSSFVTIYFTYLIGERMRRYAGVTAAALLFVSPYFQLYSHTTYGLFLCLAFVLPAYYFSMMGRRVLSGFLIVLSVFVRLNAYPLLVILLFLNRREKRFFYGLALASPLLLFALVPNFIQDALLYHLLRQRVAFFAKANVLMQFAESEWLLASLTVIGLCFAFQRLNAVKGFRGRLKLVGTDNSLILSAAIILLVLSSLMQRSIFDFYFIFVLPFASVLSALIIVEYEKLDHNYKIPADLILVIVAAYTRKGEFIIAPAVLLISDVINLKKSASVFFTAAILLASGVIVNANFIKSSYSTLKNEYVDDIVGYLLTHTKPNDKVLALTVYNNYISLTSSRVLAGDIFDMTDQHFFIDRGIDAEVARAADESAAIVFDLRHMGYLMDKGANLSISMDRIRENYYPAYYNYDWESIDERRPLVVWLPRKTPSGSREYQKPEGLGEREYFERYFFFLNKVPTVQEKTVNVFQNVSIPYIPEAIRGGNVFNSNLLVEDVIQWPAKDGQHYSMSAEGMEYDTYVTVKNDSSIVFVVDTHMDYNTVAFSELVYDYGRGEFTSVTVFSKISDYLVNGFIPNYQQTPVDGDSYLKLKNLTESLDAGVLPKDRYISGRNMVLYGTANTTRRIQL